MKDRRVLLAGIIVGFIILVYTAACTKSPFGEDEISPGNRKIAGKVILEDELIAQGVYVWLEGFGISVRTDDQGEFNLTLPVQAAQGTPDGVSGIYNLYYYLANYKLNKTELVTRNGEFIYSQGEINKHGELSNPKKLENYLDINIIIEPTTISSTYTSLVSIDIKLKTKLNEMATVIFPSSLGRPLGTVILKNSNTGELFLFQSLKGDPVRNSYIIGHSERVIEQEIDIGGTGGVLPPGQYEVIPHMLIENKNLPDGLLNSLGQNIDEPGNDYLNIPTLRKGGRFEVQ